MTNNTSSSYSDELDKSSTNRELSLEQWNRLRAHAQEKKSLPAKILLSSFGRGLCWGGIFALTAVVSATVGASLTHFHLISTKISDLLVHHRPSGSLVPAISTQPQQIASIARPVNLLIVGINSNDDTSLTTKASTPENGTSILLLKFQPQENFVTITSIPEDSKVKIPEIGLGTIQEAYDRGGLEMVAQVVSQTLNNLEIDRYVKATPKTLLKLVDLLGGVEVFVPPDVDSQGKQKISSTSGWQTLNGKQTVAFMLQDGQNTIDRIQNQQILIEAIRQRLHHPSFATNLTQTLQTLENYLDTDLSFAEMESLLRFLHQLERDEVTVNLIPNYKQLPQSDQDNFLVPTRDSDRQTSKQNAAYTGYAWRNIPISIQNTTDNPELSLRVLDYLINRGFYNVYLNKHSPLKLSQTEILTDSQDLTAANYLQQILDIGKLEISTVNHTDAELTIRLGEDAKFIFLEEGFIK